MTEQYNDHKPVRVLLVGNPNQATQDVHSNLSQIQGLKLTRCQDDGLASRIIGGGDLDFVIISDTVLNGNHGHKDGFQIAIEAKEHGLPTLVVSQYDKDSDHSMGIVGDQNFIYYRMFHPDNYALSLIRKRIAEIYPHIVQ